MARRRAAVAEIQLAISVDFACAGALAARGGERDEEKRIERKGEGETAERSSARGAEGGGGKAVVDQ